MDKPVRVEANDRQEALQKAREETGWKHDDSQIYVKLIEKKRGIFGFKKDSIYEVGLKEDLNGINRLKDEISVDGSYRIKVAENGIMLKVAPPEGDGKPVSYLKVKEALEQKDITEVDWQKVEETVTETTGEYVKIADRIPELDRDGELRINISDDRMKGFLTYLPARGGKDLSLAETKEAVKEAGIVYGLREEKLEQLAGRPQEVEDLLIAEGQEPVPGKDGRLVYHFEENQDSIGTEREDGSIDFYDLGIVTNVKPGDVLVTVEEPEPGIPGTDVTGRKVKPGVLKSHSLPPGKNTEARDEKTLVAKIEGQIVKKRNRLDILPLYKVKGNVDLTTGNINFVGSVQINGDILEGFKVKAGGNIEVRGNVSAAQVESGGDIIVYKGVIGKGKGKVKARGDIRIKFVENGDINAGNNILIAEAAMHSQLNAGDKIIINGRKGLLVGGTTRAGREVEANLIGSSLGTKTIVEVGINPEVKKKISKNEKELQERQNNRLKAIKALNLLNKIKNELGGLPPDKQKMYDKLQKSNQKLEELIEQNQNRLEELQEKVDKMTQGRIKVNKSIFPGVKLVIGKSQCTLNKKKHHSVFIEDYGEVRQLTL